MVALHTTPSRRPSRKSAIPPATPTTGSGTSGIISEMASLQAAASFVTVTSLDPGLCAILEPRTLDAD